MKNVITKFAVLVALATAVAPAMAQRMMMMGGGGGQGSASTLLFRMVPGSRGEMEIRPDVAGELKLSQPQRDNLMAMQDEQRQKMMGMFQSGERPDREKMQEMFTKMQQDADKKVKEILDDAQENRLRQLWIQRMGNMALGNETLQKELGVTEAQKAKIKELQDKQRQAMNTVRERMQNGEMDRDQMMQAMQNNRKIMDTEMGKLMTEAQRAKLKEMSGAPFKFDEDN